MSIACPNGHESEWADWCSVCGERLDEGDPSTTGPAATPPAATPGATSTAEMPPASTSTATGPTCSNCGVSAHADDVFCESCGYDFASGTLPVAVAPAPTAAPDAARAPDESAGANRTSLVVTISIDADFFGATTADVELTLPDPLPESVELTLVGSRNLVGRRSESRGILPEIDVQALTGDPGVSSRHLMFERSNADTWSFTDLGSTNGTYLSAEASADPITPGTEFPITDAMTLWLGAWTRLDIAVAQPT